MPGMRDIKRQIRSIKSTQQITKAMKMVSAAKLRKAQSAVSSSMPYAEKLQEVMDRLLAEVEFRHWLLAQRPLKKIGFVVITGDRGLCGGYNTNVIRLAEQQLKQAETATAIVAVGKRGSDYFRRRLTVELCYEFLGDNPTIAQVRELARELMHLFKTKQLDQVNLVYTKYISAIRHQPVVAQLLPVIPAVFAKKTEAEGTEYIFEPSQRGVLSELLPRYVEIRVFQTILEAKASEHGARMTAMSSATENAGEMIDELTLTFNRARQAAITKEINEVVSGAQALQ